MIPRVRQWNVSVLDDNGKVAERLIVLAPTRFLAKLNTRHDYPRTWGKTLRISVKKA